MADSTTDEDATDRVSVTTYVPRYQKEEWLDHADSLEMNQSEYLAAMVQAGRRKFGPDEHTATQTTNDPTPTESTQGADLEERVLDILATDGHTDWDELLDALTGRIEDRLETTLDELQSEDRIRYSGRHGGYTLVEE
ncbi:MAG: DUF5805 domain-containing protein [Halobacteriales archaeon]|nr:DUF5805 domain-containing protein [Halobacteriales archaeon]